MAFFCRIRHLSSHHHKTFPFSALLNPTTASHSKACVSDTPFLISHSSSPTDLGSFGSKVRFFAAPVQANPKKIEQGTNKPRMNEKIQAEVVRLVIDEGHFIISRGEALERARKLELDLVEVQGTANPPVCKIMDYHKEKYKKEVREKEQIKVKSDKTLRADSKEVKFSPKTEAKDLRMKADMVKRFMEKGYRVKCTASDSEGKDLGALFSRLTTLIEDVALVECEPTPGRGKEAYIMVRHMKFGPSKKGGGKKTKTAEKTDDANGVTSQVADNPINTVPQRDSSRSDISDSDRLHVTPTRAQTAPLPPREFSDGTRNRYRSNESWNPSPPTQGMDNRGPGMREPHNPYQRRGTPTDLHFSPSMRDPRQPQTNPPVSRNSASPQNDIPKQGPSGPSPPSGPTPGLGFGIFSNPKGDAPPRQGASERLPPNSNSPSSRPDTSSQIPGTCTDRPRGFGIFSRESSGENPNRTPKPN